MWSYLPASALTGTNTGICNHGGYCTRTLQHRGMHTATPNPGTHAWDHEHDVNPVPRGCWTSPRPTGQTSTTRTRTHDDLASP
jgi:hypothetical protein